MTVVPPEINSSTLPKENDPTESETPVAFGSSTNDVTSVKQGSETDPESLADVVVGQRFRGSVVDHIHRGDRYYIVYEADDQLRSYHTASAPPFCRYASNLCHEYSVRAETKLEGMYERQLRRLLAVALVRAFDADSRENVEQAFMIIDEFIESKTPIVRVYARDLRFSVFMDHTQTLCWEYKLLPDMMLARVAEFERLNVTATAVLSGAELLAAKNILGNELAVALRNEDAASMGLFAASREFVKNRVESTLTNNYIIATLSAAVIVGVALAVPALLQPAFVTMPLRQLSTGALGGLIGATISLLGRSATLNISQFVSKRQIAAQAIVRIALGVVFGSLAFLAIKGNIVLGTISVHPEAQFLISVAAGFSERWIPDLLTDLTHRNATRDDAVVATNPKVGER